MWAADPITQTQLLQTAKGSAFTVGLGVLLCMLLFLLLINYV
uniref:Uncharacterized protein n=1 Tax=Anguilla anguilla TaxID=7936 RepID=A0A0E9RC11_ANGAN